MSDETRTDDRRSLLAAFARAPEKTDGALVTATPMQTAVDRVIGAQVVAVKRDEHRILEKLKVLAAAAGGDWYYRYPVKNRTAGTTDWIEGPTIKLANNLAREYGNCDIDTRVTDLGDSWLILARFTDYETGFSMTRPFQQRKGQRGMRTDDARSLDIALQIGASKAIRNVIVNSLETFANFAFEEARGALVDKIGKNLPGARTRAQERLQEAHVQVFRAERVIGRPVKDWTAPDVAKIVAMLGAIEDGMTTVDDAFPTDRPAEDPAPAPTTDPAEAERASERRDEVPAEDPAPAAAPADEGQRFGPDADIERPTDAPDPVAAAYAAGKKHRAGGYPKKGMPRELATDTKRTREALAWTAGYDGQPMPEFKG